MIRRARLEFKAILAYSDATPILGVAYGPGYIEQIPDFPEMAVATHRGIRLAQHMLGMSVQMVDRIPSTQGSSFPAVTD